MLDGRFIGRAGVFGYDPLRLAVDVRGSRSTATSWRRRLREHADIHLELAGQHVLVGVFGMGGEPGRSRSASSPPCARSPPSAGLAVDGAKAPLRTGAAVGRARDDPPRGLPRRPGGRRRRRAVGRIAAESLATYPPGIPNVLPGERLTAETLAYIRSTLELGGSVRGASDRLLHTVRVVVE